MILKKCITADFILRNGADSLRFKQAVKASAALMDTLSERPSKED